MQLNWKKSGIRSKRMTYVIAPPETKERRALPRGVLMAHRYGKGYFTYATETPFFTSMKIGLL